MFAHIISMFLAIHTQIRIILFIEKSTNINLRIYSGTDRSNLTTLIEGDNFAL